MVRESAKIDTNFTPRAFILESAGLPLKAAQVIEKDGSFDLTNFKTERNTKKLVNEVSSKFDADWMQLFGGDDKKGGLDNFRKSLNQNESTHTFLEREAKVAVDVLKIIRGESWWNQTSDAEMKKLREIAKHSYRKNVLGQGIVLGMQKSDDGRFKVASDHESRLSVINTARAYDTERQMIAAGINELTTQVLQPPVPLTNETVQQRKAAETVFTNLNEKVLRAIDAGHAKREEVRAILEHKPMIITENDPRVLNNINEIVPQLLDNAQLLTESSRQQLLNDLGIIQTTDGYTVSPVGKATESKIGLRMIAVQQVGNELYKGKDDVVAKIVREDGEEYREMLAEGADLLLLHTLESEGITDCGRYFQERVRETILRTKVKEMVVINGPRNGQSETDEQALRMVIGGMEEAFFFAEGIFKMMRKSVDSYINRRINPGSFLHKVLGSVSNVMGDLEDGFNRVANGVPESLNPDKNRRERVSFTMPDFFTKYNR